MTRGSGSSGSYSYRQWVAAERAAQKERERREKEAEKARVLAESAARDEEATAKTAAVEQRVTELENLLRSSLSRDPRISFESMRRAVSVQPLDLGRDANPIPVPQWGDYAPRRPGGLQRMIGGSGRFQRAYEEAKRDFDQAQVRYQQDESARQRRIAEARVAWNLAVAKARREVDAHNAHVAQLATGFRDHDRFAVSEYLQKVLDQSPYPAGFPLERHVGYVPESTLVAVEWFLPTFDIIPEHKAFKHVKTRKAVEPVGRSVAESQRLYTSIIAQVAVRTAREVFAAAPEDMVSTVVFNGHVQTAHPATGQRLRPPP